jgi:hypothetical protein
LLEVGAASPRRAGRCHLTGTKGGTMQTNREELIRNRAYQLWEQEGQKEGRPEDYWYRAEQELGGADTEDGATAPEGDTDNDDGSGSATTSGSARRSARQ